MSTTTWRLRPLTFLPASNTAHRRPDGVGALDRLSVHAARRGHRVPIARIAHRVPQGIVQPVDHTVLAPALVVPKHRRPRWKVVRQLTPRAPGAVDVEDGVHDAAPRMHRWTATRARRGHHRLDQLPLRVGQIGRIALVLGHKSTLATSATSVTQTRRVTFPTRSKTDCEPGHSRPAMVVRARGEPMSASASLSRSPPAPSMSSWRTASSVTLSVLATVPRSPRPPCRSARVAVCSRTIGPKRPPAVWKYRSVPSPAR